MSSPALAFEPAGKLHLLVVDEDAAVRTACCEIVAARGYPVRGVADIEAARSLLRAGGADILLIDLKRGSDGRNGIELIEEIKLLQPEIAVIVMTAFATVTSAVEAMRSGATDYLSKPFLAEDLTAILERIAERRRVDAASRVLRERMRQQSGLSVIVGNSAEMEKLYRILSKVAQTSHPVLILGESGTGKELVARAIHAHGPNAARPFLPVDCGSLVPALIESELFGYVKGGMNGATRSRDGLLAMAQGGTVFLDEVGELTLDLQVKLLRALQEKEMRPIGSAQPVPFQARILAATSRDLTTMVEQGRFRRDLYYRLNVVSLRIPPLRERREDIPLLAAHFLERNSRQRKQRYVLSDDALRIMSDYAWPGNVRELENSVERACTLSTGPILHIGDLPTQLQDFRLHAYRTEVDRSKAPEPAHVEQAVQPLAELERQAILGALRDLKGDKLRAARLLGIGKTTLYRKLKEYGISGAGA
ncbi:sigma-54-dependent transcriptional regulator [Silvibacterium dinghuense]|uniref:Sigma-54-dependent Fis family transcriptional regulator n=1 Tax=Silvibacterium dinghuense TaxID=1560006 RepID=A0A4Q1SB22_9BACT|nr:sigma-54 dependent transcriptional regulator [Silvibacterium dinghuense]RXS94344.1 sigma-54-dependent Fis family transcriptional regulator [Silvibacterium dinghuense]GGH16762.1 Fis family transcriptional regulator [Silvibacterium dinghuense]